MMCDQDIQELVDSWINGNRTQVLEVIESFSKTGAMALVARMCDWFWKYGRDCDYGFIAAVEKYAGK